MGKLLTFKRPTAQDKRKGKTLCLNNHHKWEVMTKSKFDVQQGKLVTVYKCTRCSKKRHKLT
jgi:hypothetical protein